MLVRRKGHKLSPRSRKRPNALLESAGKKRKEKGIVDGTRAVFVAAPG